MAASPLYIRRATARDIAALQPLVQRAYRGETAKSGWTHEADLLDDVRASEVDLAAIIDDPAERIVLGFADDSLIGCVRVCDTGDGRAYLGLLCVDPLLQASGYGKQLIAAAEATARRDFSARAITMTVIDVRAELIAYYLRRGYIQVGRCAFPTPTDPPLHMVVLEKALV